MLLPLRSLLYSSGGAPPQLATNIPDISVTDVQPTYSYDLAQYFVGAVSFAISPPVEAGWSFNVLTGALVIDTDAVATFGPFAVTAFNGSGSTASNQFTITVSQFAQAPISTGIIPNISFARNVTITPVDTSVYFAGATSYAVLGTLPVGLSLNTTTGVISGTPVQGEVQSIAIQAQNADGVTNSNGFSITIIAASAVCTPKTVLDIVKEFCRRTGISVPASAVSSTDLQVQQIIGLLNEEGQELAARYKWQRLTDLAIFTTVSTESQGDLDGGILPCASNLDYIVHNTIWNQTTRLPVWGPMSPQDWAYMRSMNFHAPTSEYRIIGNQLIFVPPPTAGHTCYFEYKTKNWLKSGDGVTGRDSIIADDDAPLLDPQLLTLGLRWRWKQAKGLDYAEDFNVYERRVTDATSRDGTKPTLNLNGSCRERYGIQPIVFASSGNWMQ